MDTTTNHQIAMKLDQAADLLAQQGANPFRVGAYRRAADTIANLERDLRELVEQEGREGLLALPNVGKGIAAALWEMVSTGNWAQLERLRGNLDPVHLFQTVPNIGPELARRIHDALHIDTLESLEAAAYSGDLASVEGMGSRRIAAIRGSLTTLLGKTRRRPRAETDAGPDVGLLLDVDREYREKANQNKLPRIAPKRFNPEQQAWLPVLHTHRQEWHFSLLYSNTGRAHELGRTKDWVVVYFYNDHHEEGQHTIVTETQGPLTGQRVVRGREAECRLYYRQLQQLAAS